MSADSPDLADVITGGYSVFIVLITPIELTDPTSDITAGEASKNTHERSNKGEQQPQEE
ncbi:hypothetical protein GCM10009131_05740 [Morganella psychrotolerans]